jgi:cellulose biosynthesis protein BcsQ
MKLAIFNNKGGISKTIMSHQLALQLAITFQFKSEKSGVLWTEIG